MVSEEFPGVRLRISFRDRRLFEASSYEMHLIARYAAEPCGDGWLEILKTPEGLRIESLPIMEREPEEEE